MANYNAIQVGSTNYPLGISDDTWNAIYPVGSIFIGTNENVLPGLSTWTWERISEGKFLMSAGLNKIVNSTGGKSSITNVPKHSHTFNGSSATTTNAGSHAHSLKLTYNESVSISTGSSGNRVTPAPNGDKTSTSAYTTSTAAAHSHTVTPAGTISETGNESVDITPPYLAVYMWKRTE